MNISLAEHRGFCYGVKRAVELAIDCRKRADRQEKVFTFGPIIHNPQMVEYLKKQGIEVANSLDEVTSGSIIIRSHGVGPQIYKDANERNLHIVDATCPHVKKAQQAAADFIQKGYNLIIIGEHKHPEVKSIVEWSGNCAIVIETIGEAKAVSAHFTRLGIVSQTTCDPDKFQAIIGILQDKCDELEINHTICTATDLRQKAALALVNKVDAMVIIGGKNSANTSRLAELCRNKLNTVFHIETAQELHMQAFRGIAHVGITAGASTPDWLIEEVYHKMQEMDQMMQQEINQVESGAIISGKVVGVRKDEVFVDIGYKAEGVISLQELAYPVPETASDVVAVGDDIEVMVLRTESNDGNVQLSKIKADNMLAWDKLILAQENKQPFEANVLAEVKGGVSVAVLGIRGFIPASQVDVKYVEDLSQCIGQTYMVLPIEINQEKKKAVFSRKILLMAEKAEQEKTLLSTIKEGQVLKGVVRRITNFGVFVDIGGLDGLVHISDLSWQHVKSPQDVVNIGDQVDVFVLKVDIQAKKVSLSLKQIQKDPWFDAVEQLTEGKNVTGKVTKISKFGAFVEIAPGIEGLVHLSELSEHRVATPEEVVAIGQSVIVKIVTINQKDKKISLSIAKAQEERERAEYKEYLTEETSLGATIGEKLGHLFKQK